MQNKSLNERINERYKTEKATLYSLVGFLKTEHTLRLTNKWNETQTYQYSTQGTDDKALAEGLTIARETSGPSVIIEYSNEQDKTLSAVNTKRISKDLNESYRVSQSDKKRFKSLLG